MFRVVADGVGCCCSGGVRPNGKSGFLNTQPCRRWLMLMHVYMILYYYCTLYNDIVITINKISIGGGVTDVMCIMKPPRIFPTSLDTGRRGAGAEMYRTFRSRPYARADTHTHTRALALTQTILYYFIVYNTGARSRSWCV